MNIDEKVIAALDLVYPPAEAPHDVPAGNVRRGPWLNRYSVIATAAAALVLLLAYPAVTAISTGSHQQSVRPSETAAARAVTSLASLHPVLIDAPHKPRIQSDVLNGHRVTAWVASIGRSGRFVYDLGNAQLTDFSAVLPSSDSGLTDPCSWTVRLGGGTPQTYQTQADANVQMNLAGSGPMTITVAPTQAAVSAANCVMTDPVVKPIPGGTSASSAPEPAVSQSLGSPPVQPVSPAPPTEQQAQPTPPVTSAPAGPAASPSPSSSSSSPSASPSASPSGTVGPTQEATPTATTTPAAPTTDPAVEPESGG